MSSEQTEPDILLLVYNEVLDQGRRLERMEEQVRLIRFDLNSAIDSLRAFGERLGLLEKRHLTPPPPTPIPYGGNGEDEL